MNALEIYNQAEEITDPAARRRYLDEACRGDVALRARVEEMLGLSTVPAEVLPDLSQFLADPRGPGDAAPDPWIGYTVGGVRLERVVGHGGMGRVYAGVESSTGGIVALKMLLHAIASDDSMRRFEQEARLLARLRHPGIAQVHSAGTIESHGLTIPYFIMEYIPDAAAITDYAAAQNLNTAQRLDLFRRVCEAVAHGHEHGVIHRDLKPANILVDAHGQPKVIDFGVAKCTDVDPSKATLTAEGAIAGTPAYMSPEQVDGDPDAITVRCDVHALGVVLYELLAGRMPFDFRNALPMGIAQIIRTQEPTPLSSVSRAYRGDLDAIVSKCLEKDRNHRFAGAADLGAEIGRYLAGEAILTRPPGFFGGVLRLARRHKAAAAATLGVAASLVAAVVGISVFAYRAETHRKVADEQRDIATTQQTIATEQRDAAEKARIEADDYRDKALEEAANARRRLYTANLFRIRELATKPGRRRLRDLYDETVALLAPLPAGPEGTPAPAGQAHLELTAIEPMIDRSVRAVNGHGDGIWGIRHTPDGSRVVSASDDSIALWDPVDGALIARIRVDGAPATAFAMSRQGDRLLTGHFDGSVRVWSLADGELLSTLGRHQHRVVSVAFSPDGSSCASLARDAAVQIMPSDGEGKPRLLEIVPFTPSPERFTSELTYSPDGTALAATTGGNGIRIWRVADGSILHDLEGHEGAIEFVEYAPDGVTLITAGRDATIRVWNATTGAGVAVIDGGWNLGGAGQGSGNPFAGIDIAQFLMAPQIAISPDGRFVAASFNQGIAVYGTADGRRILDLSQNASADAGTTMGLPISSYNTISFSPDGRLLAFADVDQTVRVWNLPESKLVSSKVGHGEYINAIAFSPDGTTLVSGDFGGTVRWWDGADNDRAIVLRSRSDPFTTVRWSPDGRVVAAASADGMITLWDADTLEPIGELKATGSYVTAIAFSPDGHALASASNDGKARIWDLSTGTLDRTLAGHWLPVTAIAYSPDGRRLMTGGMDATARLWDTATGQERSQFEGHDGVVGSVAFSPDGSRVATATWTGIARVWAADDDEPVQILPSLKVDGGFDSSLSAVAFSPDGSRLAGASADHSVWLWELGEETLVRKFEGHGQYVAGVAFDGSGQRLVSCGLDQTVRIWDVGTGEDIVVLDGHRHFVSGVDVHEGSGVIASSSADGTVRIWGRTNDSLHAARLRARRHEVALLPVVRETLAGEGGLSAARIDAVAATLPEADRGPFRTLCLREALGGQAIAGAMIERVRIPDLTPARCAALGRTIVSAPRGINFWESPLTGAHLAAIPAIPTLAFLNLGSTGLHAADLRDLSRFPALKTLHLEFLETDGSDLAALRECPALETISLWKSTLTDAGSRVVASLPRLGQADFGSTAITDAFLEGVEPHDAMTRMRLDHTGLTDAAIDSIARWRKLGSVDLTGTSVSAEGIARLREALPGCAIVTDSQR